MAHCPPKSFVCDMEPPQADGGPPAVLSHSDQEEGEHHHIIIIIIIIITNLYSAREAECMLRRLHRTFSIASKLKCQYSVLPSCSRVCYKSATSSVQSICSRVTNTTTFLTTRETKPSSVAVMWMSSSFGSCGRQRYH